MKKGWGRKPLVDWGFSCGRTYLTVCGFVVAMEGDPLRDVDLTVIGEKLSRAKYTNQPDSFHEMHSWTGELIKFVCTEANNGKLPQ